MRYLYKKIKLSHNLILTTQMILTY